MKILNFRVPFDLTLKIQCDDLSYMASAEVVFNRRNIVTLLPFDILDLSHILLRASHCYIVTLYKYIFNKKCKSYALVVFSP